jgi:hypothetical protein
MNFQLPDPISFVADAISIVGIPVLFVSTIRLYKDTKKAREEAKRAKGVSEDCIIFRDESADCAINNVPFKKTGAIPRVGDFVYLPGERDGDRNCGDGKYQVVKINFYYREDSDAHPCPASASAIEIYVRKIAGLS